MTPAQIIRAIKEHQAHPYVHPLTCGNDSRHQVLEPQLDPDDPTKVILVCLDCTYRQHHIPEFALHAPPMPSFLAGAHPVPQDLVERGRELTQGVTVDLDEPLDPNDE